MRIAQISPLYERVPPEMYGGTERVVSFLTEELVRAGHEVTLFASGDSETSARLVACTDGALRLHGQRVDRLAAHLLMVERAAKMSDEFDIIHAHLDYLHFPVMRRLKTPSVTTLHGRLDLPHLAPVFSEFDDQPLVSISDAQRRPQPRASFVATVHHGLPPDMLWPGDGRGGYLAFVGRISPEKGADRAIDIARRAGKRLLIGAKVDPADTEYFARVVEPLLSQPGVEYLGEIDEKQKCALLGGAEALLFPIEWPEPFGLVLIESLACGTPVIAFARGSVPEIIENGRSGFVVDSDDAAVAAVHRIGELSRRACRAVFDKRFTAARMMTAYLSLYRMLIRRAGTESRFGRREPATHRPFDPSALRPAQGRPQPSRGATAPGSSRARLREERPGPTHAEEIRSA